MDIAALRQRSVVLAMAIACGLSTSPKAQWFCNNRCDLDSPTCLFYCARAFTVYRMYYDMVGQECVEGECFDLAIYPPLTQCTLSEALVCQSDYFNAPLGDVPA